MQIICPLEKHLAAYSTEDSKPDGVRRWKIIAPVLAPWRSGIAPESIGGVYGRNAMGSNPNASFPV